MNVIRSFVKSSLKNNKKWTIVTIIGVIIATAMITAVATIITSFVDLIIAETIADTGEWHTLYRQVAYADVGKIRQDDSTGALMMQRSVGYARLEGSQNANKPYLFVSEYDVEAMKHFPLRLVEGRLPQSDAELIVSQTVETNGGVAYRVGDTLTLDIGTRTAKNTGATLSQREAFMNGKTDAGEVFTPSATKTYTVVGVIERPGFETRWAPGYTAISRLDAGKLAPTDTVDVYTTAAKLSMSIYGDTARLAKAVDRDAKSVGYNDELLRYYGVSKDDKFMSIFYVLGGIITAIIMIAAISLIYNAFSISVSERLRQLGMLASVGATRRQKRSTVYLEGAFVGVVGIPLGIAAGIGGIGVTLSAISPLILSTMPSAHSSLRLVVSPLALAAAAALSALTIFLSVYIPARRASRIMPIDAIRQTKEIKLTAKAVKTSRLTRRLFGFEGELALKNLKRSRRKYRSTILSLIISIVLFLAVASIALYTKKSADVRLTTQQINFDVYMVLAPDEKVHERDVFAEITALDLVSEQGVVRQFTAASYLPAEKVPAAVADNPLSTQDGKTLFDANVMSLDDETFARYAAQIGAQGEYHDANAPRAILVNSSVGFSQAKERFFSSDALVAKAGDRLDLTQEDVPEGKTPGTVAVEVGAVTDQLPIGGGLPSFGQYLLVTSDSVFDGLQAQLRGDNKAANVLALKSSDAEALDPLIEKILKENGVTDVSMVNVAVDARQERRIMTVFGVFLYGFITLISLICVANIFNTVSTNIALRRKEFAMLRSVGMTSGSFTRMMNFESVFYGLKALLYGLPISVAVGWLLYAVIRKEFYYPFSLPWMDYGIAIVAVFAIVGATMLYSAHKVRKENIIDALKDETM